MIVKTAKIGGKIVENLSLREAYRLKHKVENQQDGFRWQFALEKFEEKKILEQFCGDQPPRVLQGSSWILNIQIPNKRKCPAQPPYQIRALPTPG